MSEPEPAAGLATSRMLRTLFAALLLMGASFTFYAIAI